MDNNSSPVMIIGDFNAVLHSNDRINGNPVSEAETKDFESFMNDASLLEAPTTGLFYSWNNKGEGQTRIASRIDKALVNADWIDKFTDVVVHYRANGVSDHSPLVFNMEGQTVSGGRPFRFLNSLCDHDNFEEVVKEAWFEKVKHALKQLHKPQAHAYIRIEELRRKLSEVQSQADIHSNTSVQQDEKNYEEQLRYWSNIEESILRQKARINWLSQGDANTKFFFAAIKTRKAKNKIAQIQNDQGENLKAS
ncbi:uncharacterized protein LOC130589895 [Beta vulgaris subsp. vulgaris]|uniref:uncharacterized protein LOC130589895 n=1 Tax=Beta vulgaris subsp. vulgaris TaxID=3555 RepID=UPI002546AC09|nr:uncharacterized protein LOC130589895 [Beta vulgaris subsp. vulgaris]